MIVLREMMNNDIPLFKKWLYLPHVAKWYHEPLDWIEEIEKQDNEFFPGFITLLWKIMENQLAFVNIMLVRTVMNLWVGIQN
ncbi:hypothetical protein [Beduini sp.]|uniref:hypothetical protein n=1 Tax=Beduini sp. TaxID=1922300 RepID=UPI0039A0950D